MKKAYKKPLAVIENFELSQHIAACQNLMVSNQAIRNGCNADPKGDAPMVPAGLFYTALTNAMCNVDGEQLYCYTNGVDDTFVFTS